MLDSKKKQRNKQLNASNYISQRALAFSKFSFYAPLNDAGAGAANLVLARGTGSATFTRASVATTTLSTGLLGAVGSGVARSLYSPSGIYLGYFAEGAATQLITPTASIRDMTDASWVAVTMTAAKTSVGWDGAANSATRLTATGAGATILQTLVAAASSRTYSCGIRRVTGTGTIKLVQGLTKSADLSASLNSSTYTLVELNASVLNAAYGIEIGTSGDAIDVDFNQFEAGTFATSRIVTAGATRATDVLTFPSSGNISLTVGSVFARFSWPGNIGTGIIVCSDSSGQAQLYRHSTGPLASFDGTTVVNHGTPTTGSFNSAAMSYGTNGQRGSMNGGAITSGAFDGAYANVGGNIGIGCFAFASALFNGTIRDVMISTQALSDIELQLITR